MNKRLKKTISVSMIDSIPINTTTDGYAFAIRARYNGACLSDLTGGGGHYPKTEVIEVYEQEKKKDWKQAVGGDAYRSH